MVKMLLKKFKLDFCKRSLQTTPNHCLFDNLKMKHLVVIEATKNKAYRATKVAICFHINLSFFSVITHFESIDLIISFHFLARLTLPYKFEKHLQILSK